jgi:predicted PurR-regulated permease PerM
MVAVQDHSGRSAWLLSSVVKIVSFIILDAIGSRELTHEIEMPMSYIEFLKRSLTFVTVATIPVLIWYLSDPMLLGFGAILVAVLLRLGAEPFIRWLSVPQSGALVLSGLLILIIVVGAGFLFETRIAGQMQDVLQRITSAEQVISASLQGSEVGKRLLTHIQGQGFSLVGFVAQFFAVSVRFLAAVIVLLISGAYLAAQPNLYRDGLIQLFPPRLRASVAETIDDIGNALRLWLLGQLMQMVLIGLLSTVAALMIGLPAPIALGLIAGVAEFVPYLGPIIASIPAVLVAVTKSPEAVVWTGVAYVIIHQTEGNLIVPLVQRHLVSIPPALMLLGIVTIGFLFGPVAVIFAAPIAVVIFVAVKKLYIRDTLGEKISIPGESDA